MIAEFGWTRGEFATAAGLGVIGGLAIPFLGRLADRVGVRPVIVFCMLMLATTYASLTISGGALWQYQLFVIFVTLSVPGTSTMVYGKLIARRFERHRGIALGVATSGISIFSLALAPVVGWFVAGWGWRAGVFSLAALIAFGALPTVLFLLRGERAPPTRPDPDAPEAVAPVEGKTGAETRADSRYWRLAATAALINFASVGLVTSLVPLGTDRGLGVGDAAWLVTAFAASQVVGRLVMGYLVDRFPAQGIAAIFALISASAFVALHLPNPGLALMMLLVFSAGLMHGAENDLLPFLTAKLFGLRAYGEVYGLLLTISMIGTSTGVIAFGRLHDATGSYGIALTLAAVTIGLAGVLFLTLRERPLPHVQAAARPA